MDAPDCVVIMRKFHPETDQAFIYATWRNSAFYGGAIDLGQSHGRSRERAMQIFKELTTEIRHTLQFAKVNIACLKDSVDTIIGYSVFTERHLDWVYVKEEFRNKGIATLIIPKDIQTHTPMITKIGQAILTKKKQEKKNEEDRIPELPVGNYGHGPKPNLN